MPITAPLIHTDLTARDLDPKVDPSLSEFNRRIREITQRVNQLAGFAGPVTLANALDLNGNRISNVGAAKSTTDVLTQESADPMYSTPVQQQAMEIIGTNMLQSTRRLNDGTQQHLISSDLNSQGSIPPTLVGQVTYVGTATTITVSFPIITYADGSSVAVNNTLTITGLTASTNYLIYPYYDTALGVGACVADSVNATGSPPCCFSTSNANAAQAQNNDGRVPLSSGAVAVATGAGGGGGGTSGGGGGSGCIRVGMLVETYDRGVIPIESVYISDKIRTRNGWTMVTSRRVGHYNVFIRIITIDGAQVDVTPTHPICLHGGGEQEAGALTLADVLCGAEGVPLQIKSLLTIEETSPIVLLSCRPTHEYLVGRINPTIVAHNQVIFK